MLPEIHKTVQHLLYEGGRISADQVDVRFDVPTNDWIDSLTRPTIDLFLFDLQENTDLRQAGMQTSCSNGKAERRMARRRIDLHYIVSVLTTEIDDEHQLLWRALVTLMRYQQFPLEVLPDVLRALDPPLTTRFSNKDEGARLLDVWSALDTPPHPALHYIVTAPVDLEMAIEVPLVLTRTVRYQRTGSGTGAETGIHIGGTVRDEKGVPVAGVTVKADNSAADGATTDHRGRFVLPHVSNGPITLCVLREREIQKRVLVSVPAESYDIVLDG